MNGYELMKTKILKYHENVNWKVFIVIILFSIGSWLDINGVFAEEPLMVHELPEGWRLPAVLTIFMQSAQAFSFIFFFLKHLFPKHVNFASTNYVILSIGIVSCLLLSIFWKKTVFILNEYRSVGLYVFTFTLGLLDGTSSVTFLPYVGQYYSKEYVIPYYVGESLSSMVPGVLGLIQGSGKDLGCRHSNISDNSSSLEPIPLVPFFSISVYYIILFVLLCISMISFSILHFATFSVNARKQNVNESTSIINKLLDDDSGIDVENEMQLSKIAIFYLISLVFWDTFFAYGVLPGVQSYATLPYGNSTFNMSINFGFILIPFVVMFSIVSYQLSITRITVEFIIAIILSIYIIVISTFSPCPPLLDNAAGAILIVFAYVVTSCLYMRIRCCIAAKVESHGKNLLMMVGSATMLGQIIGGILIYVLVDTFKLFKDAPSCKDINLVCNITSHL